MKILFLTDNFPPEVNAPATRTYEHCIEWVKLGAEVTVITCAPNFPKGKVFEGFKNKLLQNENMDGIKVVRVWSYMAENKGVYKRMIDFLSFAFSAFFVGLFIETDAIIATSPQFFTAIAGRKLGFWKRTPWIMEVRDLWPEAIKSVDALKSNVIFKLLEKQELKCYRSASGIVTATEGVRQGVVSKISNSKKVIVVTNGSNLGLFTPKGKPADLVEKYQLKGKLVISYIGTHGLVYNLGLVLTVAEKLKTKPVHFFLIGDGIEKERLVQKSKERKIENITFIDIIPKNEVVDFLALSDVTLISLRVLQLNLGVIPAKIFESAAMEKPILLGVDGEARDLIEKYGAGLYFEPENEIDLIEKINLFLNKEVDLEKMKLGCRQLAIDYDRKRLAQKMLGFIQYQAGSANRKK